MSPKKAEALWVCSNCGNEALKWIGVCESCGEWNSLKEVRLPSIGQPTKGRSGFGSDAPLVVALDKAPDLSAMPNRLSTKLGEVDRVLGGGFFPGTVVLLAGEPGIGKSTLLLNIADTIARQVPVVYASGEESTDQILQRAHRLKLVPSPLKLVSTTDLSSLLTVLATEAPQFVIVDSIQTLVDTSYPSAAGSVVQVRECGLALQRWAKATGSILILVGHFTKEGVVAGPRTLEHLVDVVMTLEGERTSDLRLLRSQKNRFGPTDEVGILAMTADGLSAVENPSARFLEERQTKVAGSVVTVILEGTRPLLVEIQALTRPTATAYPRRTASGFDLGRLELIVAVLEARAGVMLGKLDVYVNVSGGLKIKEPAADLAVALAIASAAKNKPIDERYAVFGELGLAGEVRRVTQLERRQNEAKRLGFTKHLSARTLRESLMETV